MPRKADLLFLKLAVKNRILTEETARSVVDMLDRADRTGHPTKARYVCVERGFLDDRTAKQLKKHVKDYLEKKAEVSTSGKQIGSYAVEAKLGAGAMGIVYKARHVKLGRPVALKLLLPEFAQDDVYIERFEREARAAAQLNHPNIVQCFDAGQDDDLVYIAMEFVDGRTMKDMIAEKGRLPEQEAVKLVIQVARALEHAAGHGLIHRDVKPANIMVTRDGTAKLLDLGLAKKIENQENSELTGVGHAIGTPYYMAPEQALEEQVDHRADIYALGCTLFAGIVGEPPFKAATPTGVLAKHLNDPIPSVRARVAESSLGLERVLQKMLAKKPEQRYQKHDMLVKDLEDVLAGLMPEIKSETPSSRPVVGITEGPRSRHQRTSLVTASGSKQRGIGRAQQGASGLSYAMGALAACGAIVVFLGTQKATNAKPVDPMARAGGSGGASGSGSDPLPAREGPDMGPNRRTPPPEETKEALESAARRQLEDIHRGGTRGWVLFGLLDNLARTRVGTRAADQAQKEAAEIADRLDQDECEDLKVQSVAIEKAADQGDLLGAAQSYRNISEHWKGEHSLQRSRDRAGVLEARALELCDRADQEAKRLADLSKEDEAARVLRSSLRLRKDPKPVLARAEDLERLFASKSSDAVRAAAEKDQAAIRALEIELRKDVRARKLAQAATTVRETLDQLTTTEARDRATAHAANLDQLAQLEKLALPAFAGAKGQTISFDRRQGAPIEGKIRGAGENGVTVEISQNVQATVPWNEIDEKTLVRQVRKAKGAEEPLLVRFYALAKLYRGDDDAAQAIAVTKDAALAELLKQVDASNGASVVAKNDPPETKPGSPDTKPGVGAHPPGTAPTPDPGAGVPTGKQERDQFLTDNLGKIFAGATDAYMSQLGPTAWYDFMVANRTFNGLWKVEQGEAMPTPAGRSERRGLILNSNEGNVSFEVPFTGQTSRLRVRFVSYASLSDDSRLTLVLTDTKKSDRFESSFGALVNQGKGHRPKIVRPPDDLATRISTNVDHMLELLYRDGAVSTRLDDQEIGSLAGVGIAELKFSLEWVHVNVNVLQIDVIGVPTNDYMKKAASGSGGTAGSGPRPR